MPAEPDKIVRLVDATLPLTNVSKRCLELYVSPGFIKVILKLII